MRKRSTLASCLLFYCLQLFCLQLFCLLLGSCTLNDPDSSSGDDPVALLDHVWNNVRDRYFDADLQGLDWAARYAHYKPLVLQAASEAEVLALLNRMLFELNSSHCGVDTLAGLRAKVSPYLFAEGSPGLDLRLINDVLVIKEVVKDSPADRAGLKPGFVIDRIDGRTLADFRSQVIERPPFNERNRKFHFTSEVLRQLYGPVDSEVTLRCLDGEDRPRTITLRRQARSNPLSLSPALPPIYLESTGRMLNERIAYLRFNAFQPEDLGPVLAHLDRLGNAAALIIDLRGNDGGSIEAMKRLLGRFVRERVQYVTYVNRDGNNPDYLMPEGKTFAGKVAVLVDEMSLSGAENMPSIMQSLDLAEIIGRQTPGQLLCGEFTVFQERIGLILPVAKLVYGNGRNPEGEGVIPDQRVSLNRENLLRGVDDQLQAAIDYLSE